MTTTKDKERIVLRISDTADSNGEDLDPEYKEFLSVEAAEDWLKEPDQVEWLHSFELQYEICKVVPIQS